MKKILSLFLSLILLLSCQPVKAVVGGNNGTLVALNSTVEFRVGDCGISTFQLTGTWTATVTFEGTTKGDTWVSIPSTNLTTGATSTTQNANGIYTVVCAGLQKVRAKITDYTSGTVTVNAVCNEASSQGITPIALSGTLATNLSQVNGNTVDTGTGTSGMGTQRIAVDSASSLTCNAGTGTFDVKPTDGTNAISMTFDNDSGAGTEYNIGVSLRKSASGASVELGTSSDPVRIDPTGTTPQPVSGTVTVQQSTASNLKVDLSNTGVNTTAIKVDGSAVTQPVSGTVTATQSTHDNLNLNANIQVSNVDASNGNPVPVNVVAGSTAGTEYTEGDIDLTINGSAILGEGPSDTLTPVMLNASNQVTVSVDNNPSLGASSASIGKLAANDGIDIGDVTLNNPSVTVTQLTAGNLKVDLSGTGANATAIKVDGSAVTQPVSGAVTCNAGTNLNTSMLALDTSVDGVENSLSNIDSEIGSLLDAQYSHDATFTITSRLFAIGAQYDDTSPDSIDENDIGIPRQSVNRNLYTTIRDAAGNERGVNVNSSNQLETSCNQSGTWNVGHGKTIKTVSGSLTADTDVIAAVASKRIKVIAYSFITTNNTGATLLLKSNGTAGAEQWRVFVKGPDASTPFGANLAVPAPSFLFATIAGEKLTVDTDTAATIHYSVSYFDDDAS